MFKRAIVLGLAIIMIFSVVGTSYAQDPGDRPPEGRSRPVVHLTRLVYQTAADAVGMPLDEFLQSATEDQTLSELITTHGGDPALVAADATAAATEALDNALAEGRIDQEQYDEIVANLSSTIDRIMNAPVPQSGRDRPRPDRPRPVVNLARLVYQTAADAVGMPLDEFLQSATEGQTLSELIATHGGDPALVAADATAAAIEALDNALAEGRINLEQYDEIMANLPSTIDRIMNAPVPQPGRDRPRPDRPRPVVNLARLVYQTAADAVGMPLDEFLQSATEGQTLSELVVTHGGDPALIAADATAAATEALDNALAEGRINQEQYDEIVATLPSTIDRIMNAPVPQPGRDRPRGGGGFGTDGDTPGVLE